ncbi:MAG: radical SAM protein [Ruminococcaceae bacterium]|nr:radical SAM protein [Oscillospiraceae bacterium]
MNIQSLSIVVPNRSCINNCKFCVSRMHCEDIPYHIHIDDPDFETHQSDYLKRLAFARDNGCNTVMLTGSSEPQQNKQFLQYFAEMNKRLEKPFRWIEMQTTGVLLDDGYLNFLRKSVGVNTISVSITSFDDEVNRSYVQMPEKYAVNLQELTKKIKSFGFNLRLSVNMTDYFNKYHRNAAEFFEDAKKLFNPDQMTIRLLYKTNDASPQSDWVNEHACNEDVTNEIVDTVRSNGIQLERLPYGRIKYSYLGMSLVVDDDCMSKTAVEDYKYLILQPNCRLYSRWDDTASLIF